MHLRDGRAIAVHSPGAPGLETLRAGADELAALARAAMADAAFAIVVGGIRHYDIDDTLDVMPPVAAGVEPTRLLGQVAIRLAVLAASPCPVSPYRERLVPTGRGEPAEDRRAIIERATGRRTARDIAFALGRGVHPVTVDIARMLGDDVLAIAPATPLDGIVRHGPATLRPRSRLGP